MRYFTNLRIKIIKFFKKYKKLIFLLLVIYIIIFLINKYLGSIQEIKVPITTYEPHVSIMDSTSSVPSKLQEPIEEILENFITYCNNKDYENAYNLLSDECKKAVYPDVNSFKNYVDIHFKTKKLYSIQDYSNVDKLYIYQVKLYDDFLATGLTDSEFKYYDEKITIVTDENNDLKLLVGKFIEKKDIKNVAEDDYLKIDIRTKLVNYDSETYHVRITNRSEYTIVLADNNAGVEEIVISLGLEYRSRDDSQIEKVILQPGESKEYDFTFTKFYDDGDTSQYMIFNAIRVMENYTGSAETAEEEIENAKTKYILKIKI